MLRINAYYCSLEPGDMTHYKFYIIPMSGNIVAVTGNLLGYKEYDINMCKDLVEENPKLLCYDEYQCDTNQGLVSRIGEHNSKINPWTQLAAIVAVYRWSLEQ